MPKADGPGVRSGAARLAKSHSSLRVSRGIDDLVDPERLGGAIWRAQAVQPFLDLLQLRRRVGCGVDLGAIGGLDAAFQRQRSPACRRPGVAQAQMADRLVARGRRRRSSCAR